MSNIKRNGNCKAVRCLTNGKYYHSVKEAAEDIGVHHSAVSFAIRKGGTCKGKEFGFEQNMEKNIMKMASNLSQMEISTTEMAEFYAWKAEKEAEAKRIEAELKAKEMHDAKIAKAKEKVARCEAIVDRYKGKLEMAMNNLMAAEMELEKLIGEEV